MWRAEYDTGNDNYQILYYHYTLGILLESNIRYSTGTSIWNFRRTDITIESSNLDEFTSRVTGTNVLTNLILITGIYIEIPVVAIIRKKRAAKKAKRESQKVSPE